MWQQYVSLQHVADENRRLKQEMDWLRGENHQLREAASATQRLTSLLQFKEQALPAMVAAQVIGRDSSNRYRSVILNKGESDGIQKDMGVITPAGVVGRVVKTTGATSVVLLLTDPNNAIAGLIQRTRDEGIVEGVPQGRAKLKYIPMLSAVKEGDRVVTSGLVGGFPRGLAIGTITTIDREEGALFQTAELATEVDVNRVEEVLVIQAPHSPSADQPDNTKTWLRNETTAMKKFFGYSGLVLLLVPVQTTLLPHVAIWDIKPDLGLVVAALIGVLAGELEGLMVGFGDRMDPQFVFGRRSLVESRHDRRGRTVCRACWPDRSPKSPRRFLPSGCCLLSLAGGLVAVLNMKHATMADTWWMVQFVVVPQACFDAAVGAGLLWFLEQRVALPRFGILDRYS